MFLRSNLVLRKHEIASFRKETRDSQRHFCFFGQPGFFQKPIKMILKPEQIKRVIGNVPKRIEPIKGYIPAAVLVLFFEKKNQSHLVYIRRTQGMNIHSGHMAFPGGKIDPEDDSSFATATREASEEIGVNEEQYTYLGEMGFFDTLISSMMQPLIWPGVLNNRSIKSTTLKWRRSSKFPLGFCMNNFNPTWILLILNA